MVEILNSSIAVAAEAHNPSILHPSFLVSQSIVPPDWTLSEPPICTPAVSLVKYGNGISIAIESSKLQVVDNAPPVDESVTVAAAIVEKYTRTLPHVRYTGVGINFHGFVGTDDAHGVLSRFLAAGPWNEGALRPEALGIRFVYSVAGTRLRLAFDGGAVKSEGKSEERKGVVVAANYHADIDKADPIGSIAAAVARYVELRDHFHASVTSLLVGTHAIS